MGDPEGRALGDRRLADASLADEPRVVLAPAAQRLDDLLDLVLAANHRVDPARARLGCEVAPEAVECRSRQATPRVGPLTDGGPGETRAPGAHRAAWTYRAGAEHVAEGRAERAATHLLLGQGAARAHRAQTALAPLAIGDERHVHRRRALTCRQGTGWRRAAGCGCTRRPGSRSSPSARRPVCALSPTGSAPSSAAQLT